RRRCPDSRPLIAVATGYRAWPSDSPHGNYVTDSLLRGGIRETPRHELLKSLGDFFYRCEVHMKPEIIRPCDTGFHLGRVEEREERGLPGITVPEDHDVRHR